MLTARSRKTGSSLPWYFSWQALTDSASMRAWAGSYTPQGRSQWAWPRVGSLNRSARARRRGRMRISKLLVGCGFLVTLAMAVSKRATRIEVSGDSMRPTLVPGDRVIVRRTTRPLPGHVVALADPRDPN